MYTFNINTDFQYSKVDSDTLTSEIHASAIVVALDYIEVSGNDCNVYFKAALSDSDVTLLDNVIASHTGNPLPEHTAQRVVLTNVDAVPIPSAPDGRYDFRTTTAKRTANFNPRVFSFYTANPGLIVNKDAFKVDYNDLDYKMYDSVGSVTTDTSLAVETVLDWEPTYNYEIIGGMVDLPVSIANGTTDAWYMAVAGLPDIPESYYGHIKYLSYTNLEAVVNSKLHIDGRSISYLPYRIGGIPGTNKLRFIIQHPVGESKRFQIYVEHYI